MSSFQNEQSSRLLLRIHEAAAALGISRAKMYEVLQSGTIPVVRIGRATRIRVSDLEQWVARATEEVL